MQMLTFNALQNVCAVQQGVCCTPENVQYTGGISWVHWRVLSEFIMSWIMLFSWRRFERCFSHHQASVNEVKSEIFARRGDGRSDPWVPLLPEKKLNVFNMLNMEKDLLFWLIKILYLAKLCYYHAPPRPHRKWLCYFVPYGHRKLDLRFVHGWVEKCIWNGAHIVGRNHRGK